MDIIARLRAEAPKAVACEHESYLAEAAIEIERLREELGRAYRAVRGFYHFAQKGELPDKTMLGYQSTTIGAAMRFGAGPLEPN